MWDPAGAPIQVYGSSGFELNLSSRTKLTEARVSSIEDYLTKGIIWDSSAFDLYSKQKLSFSGTGWVNENTSNQSKIIPDPLNVYGMNYENITDIITIGELSDHVESNSYYIVSGWHPKRYDIEFGTFNNNIGSNIVKQVKEFFQLPDKQIDNGTIIDLLEKYHDSKDIEEKIQLAHEIYFSSSWINRNDTRVISIAYYSGALLKKLELNRAFDFAKACLEVKDIFDVNSDIHALVELQYADTLLARSLHEFNVSSIQLDAEQHYLKALQYANDIQNSSLVFGILLGLSRVYVALEQFNKASIALNSAEELLPDDMEERQFLDTIINSVRRNIDQHNSLLRAESELSKLTKDKLLLLEENRTLQGKAKHQLMQTLASFMFGSVAGFAANSISGNNTYNYNISENTFNSATAIGDNVTMFLQGLK